MAVEQRRIGRRRKRRGAIYGSFDRLAHRLVAVACTNSHFGHFSSRYLRHIQNAFYAGLRRRRAQPRPVDPGRDLGLPAGECRTGARLLGLLLGGEVVLQILLELRLLLRLRLALLLLGGTLLRLGLLASLAFGCGACLGRCRRGGGGLGRGLLGSALLFGGRRFFLLPLLLPLFQLLGGRLRRPDRLR